MDAKQLAALDERLASQIGDDVSVVFNHESLFKQSRAAITALRAQVEALTAERDAIAAVTVAACAGVAARHRSTVEINEPLWHEGQDWAVYRIEQAIRALSPLDPVKAAAGLLLAHTEAGKDTEIGPWLRAVAGKW